MIGDEEILLCGSRKSSPTDIICSAIFNVLIGLMVAVLLILVFVTPVRIEGLSMYPTLDDGCDIVIDKVFKSPSRGDIVVLDTGERTADGSVKWIVKRVIAVGGDRVGFLLGEDGNTVTTYVDSGSGFVPLDEPYLREPMTYLTGAGVSLFSKLHVASSLKEMEEGNCTVLAASEIVVLGDNRNVSIDSRRYGAFDKKAVIGKYVGTIKQGGFWDALFSMLFRSDTATED